MPLKKKKRERNSRITESETPKLRELRLKRDRERKRRRTESETPEQRELRLKRDRESKRKRTENETHEQRELRLKRDRESKRRIKENETPEQRELRLKCDRESKRRQRRRYLRIKKAKRIQELEERLYYAEEELADIYASKNDYTSVTNLKFCEGKRDSQCDYNEIDSRPIEKKNPKYGQRIINVDHFFNAIKCMNRHKKFGCNLNNVDIVSEKKEGLYTSFVLKCSVCKFEKEVHSENISNHQDLNAYFIEGMLSLSFDFEDINILLSKLRLPSLSAEFFAKQFDKISLGPMVEIPENSVDQSADSPTACVKKRKRPQKTYSKSSALKPASFSIREIDEFSLHETDVVPQVKTNQCAKTSKSPKIFRKSFALKSQNESFSVKEFNRISSVPMTELPLKTTDQHFISSVVYSKKTKDFEVSKKNLEQNLQKTIYQDFVLAESVNENNKTKKNSQAVAVQKSLSSASDKSENFHQNDSVRQLLVEDEFEIKEENFIEEQSELLIPKQIPNKPSSNELIVGQELNILDITTNKQEINADFDDETILCLETSEMEALSKKNLPESVDQSIAVLCQQKEVRTCENKIVNGQEQAVFDVTTIKQEINTDFDDKKLLCLETSKMETLSEKNPPESVARSKPQSSNKKRTLNEKRIVSFKKSESQKKTCDHKILFAALEKSRNSLFRPKMNNLAHTKKILTTAASKEEKKSNQKILKSNSFEMKKCTTTALSREPLQDMPKSNQSGTMFLSLIPHNLASGPHQGVNGPVPTAICPVPKHFDGDDLSNMPIPVQQPENFSSNGQPLTANISECQSTHLSNTLTPVEQSEHFSYNGQPLTANILRFIGRGNMSSNSPFTLPGGTPKCLTYPIPTKPHNDQSSPSPEQSQFRCDDCNINFLKFESWNSHKKSYCIKRFKLPTSSTVTSHTLMNELEPTSMNHVNEETPSSKSLIEELYSAMTLKRSLLEASMETALDAQYLINLHKLAQDFTVKTSKELRDALSREKALMPGASLEEQRIVYEAKAQAVMRAEAAYIQEKYSAAAVEQALCRQKSAIEATVAASRHERIAHISTLKGFKVQKNQNCKSSV